MRSFTLGLVVGAVIGGGVIFGLHQANILHSTGTRQVMPFSEVRDAQALQLAERFRPWILFDSDELWQPLNVNSLMNEGKHRFCPGANNRMCPLIHDHKQFDSLVRGPQSLGAHLNLVGRNVSDYQSHIPCQIPRLYDCGTGPSSVIYYHVTESYDRFYIDYWWFLRYNHVAISTGLCPIQTAQRLQACDEHEGDWEGITVVTPPDDAKHIAYVVYAAHAGAFRYAAGALHMVGRQHDRPIVYVANGSHASYPQACGEAPCFEPVGLAVDGLVDLPEGRYDGRLEWPRDLNSACQAGSCLVSLRHQPWTYWPGLWGAGCEGACGGGGVVNSPQSPGLQARYQTPWCSSAGSGTTCDGRVATCTDWLGPQVRAALCDPEELSKALRSSNATALKRLTLLIGGRRLTQETTPGVIQSLGKPLAPPADFTAVLDGPNSEILVQARYRGVTYQDRFAGLHMAAGQSVRVTVRAPRRGGRLIVRAGNRRPTAETIQGAGRRHVRRRRSR